MAPACAGATRPASRIVPSVSGPSDVYRDVPCSGEALGDGCATPPPTPRAGGPGDRVEPLRDRRTVDIPVDHLGSFEVEVGEARLPNGALTAAR